MSGVVSSDCVGFLGYFVAPMVDGRTRAARGAPASACTFAPLPVLLGIRLEAGMPFAR